MPIDEVWERKLKELEERKAKIELAGGADKIEKQHQIGKAVREGADPETPGPQQLRGNGHVRPPPLRVFRDE